MQAVGWAATVASRHPSALAERYAAAGIPVIATPAHQSCYAGPGGYRAANFADIMGTCGFADAERLAAVVSAWDAVLARTAPDLVIADYSPLLSLAAFGRVPVIAVGDGFVNPPGLPDGGFPPIGDVVPPIWSPDRLLETARALQRARGLPQPDTLAQIVAGAGQVVSVPPELDIFAAARPRPADGPWERPPPPLAPPGSPHVFAYLRPSSSLARRVLAALAGLAIPATCHLPDAPGELIGQLERAGIRVHIRPLPLREALAAASVLIHHGGIGSIEEAALAGRPQLLLPRHLEQRLNVARALESLPGAVSVGADLSDARLRQGLPGVLNDARLMAAAQARAVRFAARPETAWDALARCIERATGLRLPSP